MPPAPLAIILHGVSAWGRDMARIEAGLDLAGLRVARPDGIEAYDGDFDARQWFSIQPPRADTERLLKARPKIDALWDQIIADHGLTGQLDRVALLGFSQGAIVVLDAVCSGRWPVAAAACFSGRLRTPEPWVPPAKMPLLLVHGAADPAIPFAETLRARDCLADRVALRCEIEPDLGHEPSSAGIALAREMLADVFQLPR